MNRNPNDPFRLSRIEAEGWNTAHRILAGGTSELNDVTVAACNPYVSNPARSRWLTGFRNAVAASEGK